MSSNQKKANSNEPSIKIRILKALGSMLPYGINKHFVMGEILRNMKRPNIITNEDIWYFLETNFTMEKYDEENIEEFKNNLTKFNDIYNLERNKFLEKKIEFKK